MLLLSKSHPTTSLTMAWQCLGRRRQALLLKLLSTLLFAVASLNFFISWRLRTDERRQTATEVDASNDETAVVISAGHLSDTLYLPTALRPKILTRNEDDWCCQIASSTNRPKRVACHGTCFLPSACTDTMYPHQSIQEQEFYQQVRQITFENRSYYVRGKVVAETDESSLELQRQCQEMNSRLLPPYQWCHQWLSSSSLIDPDKAKLPPPGCSLLDNMHSSYQNLLLFPNHNNRSNSTNNNKRLAFCGIPKNGITSWIQLLRFIIGAPDYRSIPYEKQDWKNFRFETLEGHVQLDILNNEDYVFVAFLRDPAERLLSLYLDKVNGTDKRWKSHFVSRYGLNDTPSFAEFIRLIAKKRHSCPFYGRNSERLFGVDWCTDPHWAPQTLNCGLSEFLPRFQFIGSLERIGYQSKKILQHVGLWESYGRYYHEDSASMTEAGAPTDLRNSCVVSPPRLRIGEKLSGFQHQGRHTMKEEKKKKESIKFSHHSTQSQSKLDMYYTEELLDTVKRLYANDYKIWDLIKDEEELVGGSELAMKLSPMCRERVT